MINLTEKESIAILHGANIREALKQMDKVAEGILFVVDSNRKLIGTLTDGDIRRALLKGNKLTDYIEGVYNSKPFVMKIDEYDKNNAIQLISVKRIKAIPIVNADGILVAYERNDEALAPKGKPSCDIGIPVVIMAGGKGTRMAPFTNVLPKPLIPIGDKTILEIIIDEFLYFGVKDYYVTINYKGGMIRAYFDCIEHDYNIKYLKETEFTGTAGSLTLLPRGFAETFIVSNCDIIIKADFLDVLHFHRKSEAALTILSSIQHHLIPYGVIKFESGGIVSGLEEKPEFSFCINTGVYILEAECLEYIPENTVFHMTHLIEALMKAGKRVVTYPVNENEYIDIGQWEEYQKAVSKMTMNI